jgi:hydrogenase nickel incorporation protein HypB
MCATCGCADDASVRVVAPGHEPSHDQSHHAPNPQDHDRHGEHDRPHALNPQDHDHPHQHAHPHAHDPQDHDRPHAPETRTVILEQDVLAKNDLLAERNRGWLRSRNILAVNVMSSPGAGKTTLLARSITELGGEFPISVIEGDQETLLDAERIKATGAPVVQINTGAGCHLDADMLERGLATLDPAPNSVLFIENVGNLVCPALFDLGEEHRAVIMSVTEGPDKPLKYPHMFAGSDLVLLNKVDLLPYLDFDVDAFLRDARKVNPRVEVLRVSATTGEGLPAWYDWLRHARTHA